MPHRPRKRFGQHFLNDPGVVDVIATRVAASGVTPVIEIGPGEGVLTEGLIARGLAVRAVEIDRDLVPGLMHRFAGNDFLVTEADALEVDYTALGAGEPYVVCGNLPYNISSPLLFRLARLGRGLDSMTFMLQKEVVDRILAVPGTRDYGRLSVMLGLDFTGTRLVDVPPASFSPPPKVDSSVVVLTPRAEPLAAESRQTCARLVAAAFAKRRKTLRNALSGLASADTLETVGIDPSARAETVPFEAFARLADRLEPTAGEDPATTSAPYERAGKSDQS